MIQIDKLAPPPSPSSTGAVDIIAMVGLQEIPASLLGPRYTLSPVPGDEQAYFTLRDTLERTHRIGIALVVLQAQPQLVALLPRGDTLVLNTLRCGTDDGVSRADWLQSLASLAHAWSVGLVPDGQDSADATEDAWIAQAAADVLFERALTRSRRHPGARKAARVATSPRCMQRRR